MHRNGSMHVLDDLNIPELILPKMLKQKSIVIIAIISAAILAISPIGIIQNTAYAH